MKFVVALLIFSSMFLGEAQAFASPGFDQNVLLSTRNVLETIYFRANSVNLSSSDKRKLENLSIKLSTIDDRKYVVRVEGVVNGNSATSSRLRSFNLARVVVDYISARSGYKANVYLTGFSDLKLLQENFPDRVEIVCYKNIIDIHRNAEDVLMTDFDAER